VEINIDDFLWKYSLGRDDGMNSSHFLRIKIPGGILSSEKLSKLADLCDEYGKGYAEITTRQDIQFHWIDVERGIEIFRELSKIGFTTDLCGQAFMEACHGDVRNVVCCPLTGKTGGDARKLVRRITEFFSGNPAYVTLPHKFKIAIATCGQNCVRVEAHDISLLRRGSGYLVYLGGGIGISRPGIRFARPFGVIQETDVFDFIKEIVEAYKTFRVSGKHEARFKNFLEVLGVDALRRDMEKKFEIKNFKLEPGKPSEHEFGKQENGMEYFTLPVESGVLNSEKLRAIANACEDFSESGEIRLTPWQNVCFVDITDVDSLKVELSRYFDLNVPRMHLACPSNFCGKRIDAKGILPLFRKVEKSVAISGCSNGCACHIMAEFGLCAKFRKGKQLFDVYSNGKLIAENLTLYQTVELAGGGNGVKTG
jgi:sulfite reductase beta subunit-like hemoprotein